LILDLKSVSQGKKSQASNQSVSSSCRDEINDHGDKKFKNRALFGTP